MNNACDFDEFSSVRKTINKTALSFGVFAIVYIASSLILGIIFALTDTYLFTIPYESWILSVVPLYFIAFPIFCVMLPKNTEHIEKTKMPVSQFILIIPICYLLIMVGNLIGELVVSLLNSMPSVDASDPIDEMLNGADMIIAGIVTVIIAPIMEEIVFRRLLIDRLHTGGDRFAVIVSALFFGLFHGNFSQFFYATLLGLILGIIYLKTGRVIYTILIHMFVNFFSGILPSLLLDDAASLLEILEKELPLPEGEPLVPLIRLMSYLGSVFALVVCGLVLFILYFKKILGSASHNLTKRQTSVLIWKNPGMYLTVGICIVLFVIGML